MILRIKKNRLITQQKYTNVYFSAKEFNQQNGLNKIYQENIPSERTVKRKKRKK